MFYCKITDVDIYNMDALLEKISNPKTFIVELFPYYVNNEKGNISKYARGKDYHVVVKEILEKRTFELLKKYPDNKFVSFCDISPLPEVEIAYKSGAGILGKQGLIFDEIYGGYVFIGIIATDLDMPRKEVKLKKCIECGLCEKACPTDVIRDKNYKKCLSHQTQWGGEDVDLEQISNSPLIWGCDICLDVCPMNKTAKKTDIIDFTSNLIKNLEESDILGLTRKQFVNKYPNRAFTFRGPAPLIRNLKVRKYRENKENV